MMALQISICYNEVIADNFTYHIDQKDCFVQSSAWVENYFKCLRLRLDDQHVKLQWTAMFLILSNDTQFESNISHLLSSVCAN